MNKELVLTKLKELGFTTKEVLECGYFFKYEELNFFYMPDDDDEVFLKFALPYIYEVTEENKPLVLEVINDVNVAIKYSKTCIMGDDVWVLYEYRLFGEDNLEDIIEHCLILLQATFFMFHRKIEGDDACSLRDDDEFENETKEDE